MHVSTIVLFLPHDASYTDLCIVHHGLPPADEPVRSARAMSFARCLILNLISMIRTILPTTFSPRTKSTDRTQLLHQYSLPGLMKIMPPTMNRMWVFLLDTRAPPHRLAGETSPRSAFPPLVVILSGSKPVRTGTANHILDIFVYSFPSSLLISPSCRLGIALFPSPMLY